MEIVDISNNVLTHINEEGRAKMVDISQKFEKGEDVCICLKL